MVEIEARVVDIDGVVTFVVLHLDHHYLLDLDVRVAQVVSLRLATIVLGLLLLGI